MNVLYIIVVLIWDVLLTNPRYYGCCPLCGSNETYFLGESCLLVMLFETSTTIVGLTGLAKFLDVIFRGKI